MLDLIPIEVHIKGGDVPITYLLKTLFETEVVDVIEPQVKMLLVGIMLIHFLPILQSNFGRNNTLDDRNLRIVIKPSINPGHMQSLLKEG